MLPPHRLWAVTGETRWVETVPEWSATVMMAEAARWSGTRLVAAR